MNRSNGTIYSVLMAMSPEHYKVEVKYLNNDDLETEVVYEGGSFKLADAKYRKYRYDIGTGVSRLKGQTNGNG